MATGQIPPPPTQNSDYGSHVWQDWFRKIYNGVQNPSNVSWGSINFTGSNLANIQIRQHNILQSLQGGATSEYFHLSNTEYLRVQNVYKIRTTTTDTTVNGNDTTVLVDCTSGDITLTLSLTVGKAYHIKKIDSSVNVVHFNLNVDGTIFNLTNPLEYVTLISDGTNIYRIG